MALNRSSFIPVWSIIVYCNSSPVFLIKIFNSIKRDFCWIVGDLDSIHEDLNKEVNKPNLRFEKEELIEVIKKGKQWLWGTFIALYEKSSIPVEKKILSEFAPSNMQIDDSVVEIRILDGCEIEILSKDYEITETIKKIFTK